jgi:hypothetical protein
MKTGVFCESDKAVDKKKPLNQIVALAELRISRVFFNIFTAAIGSKFLVMSPLRSIFKILVLEIFNRVKF